MFKKGVFSLLKNQTGQTLLIFVLIMVIALTIVLSVASRSITNLKVSQEQESSQKALSAAEAGVERMLANPSDVVDVAVPLQNNSSYKTSLAEVSGATNFLLNGGYSITKNNYVYVWASPYSQTNRWQDPWSGKLNLYWGNSSDGCSDAALEITVISHNPSDPNYSTDPSGSTANPVLKRYAYDPCPSLRPGQKTMPNSFTTSGISASPTPFNNVMLYKSVTIPLTNAYIVSVSPIFGDSYIGAGETKINSNDPDLPDQGVSITAVGSVDMAHTQVKRVLSDFQGFPQIPPELFPYTIFSP